MDPRVRQTIETMTTRLHSRLTTAELAASVGLSVAQLTRLFRVAVGNTPAAYLQQLRLERAHVLIARTSLPVSTVMTMVGIADRSHFARDFRRAYGHSPRRLRMHLRSVASGCG